MTYVMSDLHGMYDRFIAMLEKIDFSDSDELFIIGDIIDRGERPVDILEYVMDKPNITVLLGNHEVMARDLLSRLTTEITEENINSVDDDFLIELSIYKRNGGATTMKQLRALPPVKRKEIIDLIDSLYAYEAIDIGLSFLCTQDWEISEKARRYPSTLFMNCLNFVPTMNGNILTMTAYTSFRVIPLQS